MNRNPLGPDDKISTSLPFSRREFAKLIFTGLGAVEMAGETAAQPTGTPPEDNGDNVEGPYESATWTVEGLGNHRVHIAVPRNSLWDDRALLSGGRSQAYLENMG